MKRILALILSVLLMISLTACGEQSTQGNDDTPSANVVSIESENTDDNDIDDTSVPSNKESKPDTADNESTKTDNDNTSRLNSDFKTAMDSYENFMNEYVAFMKKYSDNPTDLSLLSDYATYMSNYADFVADFEKWEDEELNAAEIAYYIDVQARVSKKLLEVAQ